MARTSLKQLFKPNLSNSSNITQAIDGSNLTKQWFKPSSSNRWFEPKSRNGSNLTQAMNGSNLTKAMFQT